MPLARHATDPADLYRRLHAACLEAGAFSATPGLAALRLFVCLGGISAAWLGLMGQPDWPIRALWLLLASFCGVQCGMLSHDAGHGTLSRRWLYNAVIGHLCDTLAIGYCFSQWRHQHDLHHAHPNETLNDPDIRTPFFAVAPGQPRHALARWLVPRQGVLLWVVLALYAFVVRVRTTAFMLRDPRATAADRAGLLAHYALWLGLPLLARPAGGVALDYALWTLGLGCYFSLSFAWNHLGCRQFGPGERPTPFEQRLWGARTLRGGRWTTVLFGGLNLHCEHHLFPQVPTGNLHLVHRELARLASAEALDWRPVRFGAAMREVHAWFVQMSRLPAEGRS